jgi:hypothetical protein
VKSLDSLGSNFVSEICGSYGSDDDDDVLGCDHHMDEDGDVGIYL